MGYGHMKGSCTSKGGGKHDEKGGKGKGGGKGGGGGAGKGKGVYEFQAFSDGAWPTLAPNPPGLSQPWMMPTQEGWTNPDTYGQAYQPTYNNPQQQQIQYNSPYPQQQQQQQGSTGQQRVAQSQQGQVRPMSSVGMG